jgi:hypothetical protein
LAQEFCDAKSVTCITQRDKQEKDSTQALKFGRKSNTEATHDTEIKTRIAKARITSQLYFFNIRTIFSKNVKYLSIRF